MDNELPKRPFSTPTETQTAVGRLSERIARRELFRRGGKWAAAFTLAGVFAGITAKVAFADSANCGLVDCCACDNGVCYYNNGADTCPIRYASQSCNTAKCPSGGYCWTEEDGNCSCTWCDYWCTTLCTGTPCRCPKCTCPGNPALEAALNSGLATTTTAG